jgi:uncharacterized protein YtpQ (UPF0354 family)
MGFFKKLFGKTENQPENKSNVLYDTDLERQGYINLGKSIFPLVRNKNESKFTIQMPAGSELCTREIAGDLLIVYVVDAGENFQYCNHNMFEKYGLGFQDLEKTGLRNLFAKTDGNLKIQTIDTKDENNPDSLPFFRVILDGVYDVSLLIGENFLDKMQELVNDDTVAFAAPRKDVLLLSPVKNKYTLAQMALTAGSLFINAVNENNNTSLSNYILLRKEGKWIPYENSDSFYTSLGEV